MSTQVRLDRPARTLVFCFTCFCVAAIAVAIATKAHIIDAAATKRALGLLIGITAVAIGNFLPKARPLQTLGRDPAKVATAERFAGWVLVLIGIAYVALFLFAPLNLARTVSSVTAVVAIVIIAANCFRLEPSAVSCYSTAISVPMDKRSVEKRRLLFALLFAFFWILTTACATSLFAHQGWDNNLAWLIAGGFWMPYLPGREFRR